MNLYLPQAPPSLVICAVDFLYYSHNRVKAVIFTVIDFLRYKQQKKNLLANLISEILVTSICCE